MEFDSCSNVLENGVNTLSNLLLKSTDPTLCALNIDDETNDGTQLMQYQNVDFLSHVDIKFNNTTETYTIPLLTISNGSSIIFDSQQFCSKQETENSLEATTTNNILIQNLELVNTIEIHGNINEIQNSLSSGANDYDNCEAVIYLENIDESVTHINHAVEDNLGSSSDQIQDDEDEITKALLSLGVNKEFFIPDTDEKSKKKVWSCIITKCNFSTVKLVTLKIHLLKHFDRRPFKCKFIGDNNTPCTWAFFSKSKLQRHQNVHTKEVQYMCKYENCFKVFSCKANLKCHLLRHEKALEHCCPLLHCKQSFNTLTQYHAHMKQHSDVPASHKCGHPGCNKSYYLASALQSHRRVHVNDTVDLTCKLCNRKFKAPCRLKAHNDQVHNNIRKFKCLYDQCGWSFATNSKLTRHMTTHLDSRKYVCLKSDCGKSFLRSDHLQEHVLSHSTDRPKFTCSYEDCQLSFCAKSSLYAHLKHVHSRKSDMYNHDDLELD